MDAGADAEFSDFMHGRWPQLVRLGCVPHFPLRSLLRVMSALNDRSPGAHVQVTHAMSIE